MEDEKVGEFVYRAADGNIVAPPHGAWPRRCVECNCDVPETSFVVPIGTSAMPDWLWLALPAWPLLVFRLLWPGTRIKVGVCGVHRNAWLGRRAAVFTMYGMLLSIALGSWFVDLGEFDAASIVGLTVVAGVVVTVIASLLVPVVRVTGYDGVEVRIWPRGDGAFARSLPPQPRG